MYHVSKKRTTIAFSNDFIESCPLPIIVAHSGEIYDSFDLRLVIVTMQHLLLMSCKVE